MYKKKIKYVFKFKLDNFFLQFIFFVSLGLLISFIKLDNSLITPDFTAFIFESKLFFNNFLTDNHPLKFFYRNWSTDYEVSKTPLYYFHNLDLFHLFFGYITNGLDNFKTRLFSLVFSLILTSIAFAFLFSKLIGVFIKNKGEKSFIFYLILLTLFIVILFFNSSFIRIVTNPFLALLFFLQVSHFFCLHKLSNSKNFFNQNFYFILFIQFIMGLCETTLGVFSLLISSIFLFMKVIFFQKDFNKDQFRSIFIKNILIVVLLGAMLIIPRIIQLLSIYLSDISNILIADLQNISKAKTTSLDYSFLDIKEIFEKNNLVFWGVSIVDTTIGQFKEFFFLKLPSLIGIILCIFFYPWQSKKNISSFYNTSFIFSLSFFTASFIIIVLFGDTFLKVGLRNYSIANYALILDIVLIFLLFVNLLSLSNFKNDTNLFLKFFSSVGKTILFLNVLLIISLNISFNELKNNPPQIDKILDIVNAFNLNKKDNVLVISNYEPSIAAHIFNKPISMSWFFLKDKNFVENQKSLINVYNVNDVHFKCDFWFFITVRKPYSFENYLLTLQKHNIMDKNNTLNNNFMLIYRDKFEQVFRNNTCKN